MSVVVLLLSVMRLLSRVADGLGLRHGSYPIPVADPAAGKQQPDMSA